MVRNFPYLKTKSLNFFAISQLDRFFFFPKESNKTILKNCRSHFIPIFFVHDRGKIKLRNFLLVPLNSENAILWHCELTAIYLHIQEITKSNLVLVPFPFLPHRKFLETKHATSVSKFISSDQISSSCSAKD